MTYEDLCKLARDIRPGMSADDIDQLSQVSEGLMTSQSLVFDGSTLWPDPKLKPCTISFDANRKVRNVNFRNGAATFKGLDPLASLEAVRQSFPGHRDAYYGKRMKSLGNIHLEIGRDATGAAVVCGFKDGTQRSLAFWAPDALAKHEDEIWAHDEQEVLDQIAIAANEIALGPDPVRQPDWKRTAHPDDRLRDWAKNQSAWGDESVFATLAEYLITKSTREDRHVLMQIWNWDYGMEVPFWIARQPDTARATVILSFWLAEPDNGVHSLSEGKGLSHSQNEFLVEIARNLTSNFYKRKFWQSEIASPSHDPLKLSGQETEEWHRAYALLMPPEVFAPIPGRKLSLGNHPWRFPVTREQLS